MEDRHHCEYPGCDKSFRRLEHLRRHKLNHTDCTIKCPQCDRLFYRNDLLQRHLTLKHRRGTRRRGTSPAATPLTNSTDNPSSFAVIDNHAGANYHSSSQTGLPHASGHPDFPEKGQNGNTDLPSLAPPTDQTMMQGSEPISLYSMDPFTQSLDWMYYPTPTQITSRSQQLVPEDHAEWSPSGPSIPSIIETSVLDDFYISLQVHEELMSLIPNHEEDLALTCQGSLNLLESAFRYLACSLPVFHRPTFRFQSISSELRASIFCVGLLTCEDPKAHKAGCDLLNRLQRDLLVFAHGNPIKIAEIEILLAMLLLEFAGMFLADRTAMELSDIFHGTLITLSRRLDLFAPPYEPNYPSGKSLQDEWINWVHKETSKRLAYFVFVIDLLHVLFFGHNRAIFSTFTIKLDLPCEDAEWQAAGSPEWRSLRKHTNWQGLKFNKLHQSLLGPTPPLDKLQSFSALPAFLLLCGLASIAADLRRRDDEPLINAEGALHKVASVFPLVYERLVACITDKTDPLFNSGQTVYYVSVISFRTPLDYLEWAANSGFSRVCVTPRQHAREAMVRLLTRHRVSDDVARSAILLLRLYIPAVSTLVLPYETSALYIGTLTLWAYTIGEEIEGERLDVANDLPEVDVLDEFERSIETRNLDASRGCWYSLVRCVAKRLGTQHVNNAREYSEVLRSLEDSTI